MDWISPEIEKALARAAEWKALGASWPAVADQLGEEVEVIRGWTKDYPVDWDRMMRHARAEATEAAISEAYQVLLNGMRSQDERIRHESAKIVERVLARQKKKRTPTANKERAATQKGERSRKSGTRPH